jgi:alpha-tubulin suppressor-like RCC1 family protein
VFASISFGSQLCGLSVNGRAYCQTGIRVSSGPDSASTPQILVPLATRHRFRSLVSGYGASCALTPAGQGFCWGDGSVGSLGTGQFGEGYFAVSPTAIATSLRFVTLASGGGMVNCGVATDGSAYCWGGETGSVYATPRMAGSCTTSYWQRYASAPCAVPTPVTGAPALKSLSTQMQISCGLSLDGHASCWGIGPNGELGNGMGGDGAVSVAAVPIVSSLAFATVSVGATFVCALAPAGKAYCWGNNFNGFLGAPGGSVGVPQAVAGGLTFQALAAGGTHTCAIDNVNDVWCWGGGEFGQLGRDAGSGAALTPTRVSMPLP